MALPDTGPERFAALRLLVHAGSPCPPALKRTAMALTGPDVVWEFYGSTEGQFTVCPPAEWLERPGTVGRARPGREVSVDGDGLVWCRPPAFARFVYWRDEARTAAAWRDGAFTVGDLGRLDDDGYLFLDGRRDDLVITGGVNVYPAEVEAALAEVPGVEEVAVFGVADDRWGQRVCAAVVPTAGADPDRVLDAAADHAATHLAGYKRPKQYAAVAVLPRTATGKMPATRAPRGARPGVRAVDGTGTRRPSAILDAMPAVDPGPPLATTDPTTGEVLETFAPLDDAALEARLAVAAAAGRTWAATSFEERARLLVTAAELFEGEVPDIAHTMTTEMGKPFAQAKGEVAKCAHGLRWFAEHAEEMLADREVPVEGSLGLVAYQPLGVILAVMPWNFPLWQVVRFLAPALMAGNVGLLKHAPNVPRTALVLEDLFRRAGAPAGVFQALLVGTDQVPGIIADERVAAVTLTGSVGAGRAVAAHAGAVGKKVVLELGGSDPFIVLPSADLDRAVPVAVEARIQNAGQSCIAAKRFIVHRDVAEEFSARFVASMAALSVGDPFDPATEVGPLVNAAAVDGIEAQVEDARAKGATVLCGGERVVGPGGAAVRAVSTAHGAHRHRPGHAGGDRGGVRSRGPPLRGGRRRRPAGPGQRHGVRPRLERVDRRPRRAAALRRPASRPGRCSSTP